MKAPENCACMNCRLDRMQKTLDRIEKLLEGVITR